MEKDRSQGWDMRAIARIADEQFGGLKPMFREFGWEWPGAAWLGVANKKIVEEYGSIAAFKAHWTEKTDVERDGHSV